MVDKKLKNGCKCFKLPVHTDERGSISYIEESKDIPINIQRVYYIYNVPNGCRRGKHAHRKLEQVMIAVSGEFDVYIDDGEDSTHVTLNSPDRGLYLAPMTWRELYGFTEDAVCLVLASELYDEADYIHQYDTFEQLSSTE